MTASEARLLKIPEFGGVQDRTSKGDIGQAVRLLSRSVAIKVNRFNE